MVKPTARGHLTEYGQMWRGHSCLPRRDSSRRLCPQCGSTLPAAIGIPLLFAVFGVVRKASRRSRRGRHECPATPLAIGLRNAL